MVNQIGSKVPGRGQAAGTEADFDAETIVRLPLQWWQDRRVALGAAVAIALLALASAWLANSASIARERMMLLEAQAEEGFLLPPGAYTIEVEGFTWRGETEPFGRVGLRVAR